MTSPAVLSARGFLGALRAEQRANGFTFTHVTDRADENIPVHTHTEAHFFLLLRGIYRTDADDEEGTCGPATLLFVPSGTTHRDHFEQRGGSFFAVSIEQEVAESFSIAAISHRATMTTSPLARQLSYRIYGEFAHQEQESCAVMSDLAIELIDAVSTSKRCYESRRPKWLVGAIEALEATTAPFTVAQLARAAGVHPLHFARTFRRFHHCSPGEYLRARRIERATRLLTSSGRSLADVAADTGFADQSQMTNALRRHTALTPAQLRRSFSR